MNQDADDDAIAKTIIRKIGDTKGSIQCLHLKVFM